MKRASSYDRMKVLSVSRFGGCMIVGLCILLLTCQLSCEKVPFASGPATQSEASAEPMPPDLSRCERIEIRFGPSILGFFCIAPRDRLLLNQEEIRYLESAEPFIVDNPEVIQTFAKDISSSKYTGPILGISGVQYEMYFHCYERGGREISFSTLGNAPELGNRIEADGHRFKNYGIHFRTLVPQIIPFMLRVECAYNLRGLRIGLNRYLKEEKSYPRAIEWFDAMVHRCRVQGYTLDAARLDRAINCPSASHGQYHYAMNPACEPNSPPDTVLLFESRPGRNQSGGPEVFTFDNHNPKGGCVILNDGTVKFIRTNEELQQLRWK